MGATASAMCCCDTRDKSIRSHSMYDLPEDGAGERDLMKPITLGIFDKYRLFELSLPFARTDLNIFCAKLKLAVLDCCEDGDDFLTIAALKNRFKTEAWKPLNDENSVLYRFLTSSAFKRKGLEAD